MNGERLHVPERMSEEESIVSAAGEPHGTAVGIRPHSIAFPESFHSYSFFKALGKKCLTTV